MNSKPQTLSLDSLEIDLQQYWLVLKRRWLPAFSAFSVVFTLAAVMASLQKPTYQAQGKLLLKADRTALFTGVGTEVGEFSPLTVQSSPLKTETEVLLSIPLIENTIARIKANNQGGKVLEPINLLGRLKVTTVAGADVLKVAFEDRDAKMAAVVVNELMQAYIDKNISTNRGRAAAAREFIAQQLPKTEGTVRQADAALRRFKEKNGITNLEEESKALVANAASLEADMTKTSTELADTTARLRALQSKVGLSSEAAIALNSVSQAAGVQQALKDLQDTQNQLAVERSRYKEQYPTVVNLKQKEDALRELLRTRVSGIVGSANAVADANLQIGSTRQSLIEKFVSTEVDRLGLASRAATLSDAAARYRQRASTFPRLEQDQRGLQRRLEVSQSTYETLLKKLQEVQVAEKQDTGNARIIELALMPTSPAGSKKTLSLVMGGLLAVLTAIIVMIVLESRDRSVKTLKQARQLFPYTWLGSIPQVGKIALPRGKYADCPTPALPVRDLPRSPASTAYRMLQANLKFLNVGKTFKTVVVTSAVPKEGKSTISANLATTIANLGRRVLLIDADLYHPQQHHIWHLTNAMGLTNVIVGETDLAKALTTVVENLDVLTAGVIPPNPLAVLDSKPMQALVKAAAQQYDFVILDASPLGVEAEALTLGKMTDGLLLVIRPGVLDFVSAQTVKELLQQSEQTILGMVVNCAASEAEFSRFAHYTQDDLSISGADVKKQSSTSPKGRS